MSISLGSILSKLETSEYDPGKGNEIENGDRQSTGGRKRRGNKPRKTSGYSKDGIATIGDSSTALVDSQLTTERPSSCWGARHTLAFMGFLGTACVYAMRVNLSVAIVAMVKTEEKNSTNSSNFNESEICLPPDDYDATEGGNVNGEFDWNESTQGLILGSFFYGYIFTNIVGGRAAEYFGGKIVYGLGIVATAIFTILSPVCAKSSIGLFVAIRVLEGAAEGVTFPAMNSLLATWIPPNERARFSAMVYAGVQFGTVITMPVSGWLCDTDFLGGWPSVFYIFGGLGVLWGVAWFLLVFNHPEVHPRISEEEKAYITERCGNIKKKPVPIPWLAILTSLPFWAILIIHFGNNWGFYTLLTELPTYLKNIQHFDMKKNGLLSALPYFVMWIFSLVYSQLIDYLQKKDKISNVNVRRLSMAIGVYGPMLGLIGMCFVDCDEVLAMVVLCISVGMNGAIYCGYMCSHQDLSPNLAGTLMGITNTVATIPGFTSPSVTGAITNGNQTLTAWRTVFLISTGVYLVTNTFYLIFITADVQPWNFIEEQTEETEETKKDADKQRY